MLTNVEPYCKVLMCDFCATSISKRHFKNSDCLFFPELLVDIFGGCYNIIIKYNDTK